MKSSVSAETSRRTFHSATFHSELGPPTKHSRTAKPSRKSCAEIKLTARGGALRTPREYVIAIRPVTKVHGALSEADEVLLLRGTASHLLAELGTASCKVLGPPENPGVTCADQPSPASILSLDRFSRRASRARASFPRSSSPRLRSDSTEAVARELCF